MSEIRIYGLKLPLIEPGSDIPKLIVETAQIQGIEIEDGDIIVITCKIISKAMGLLYKLDDIAPSAKAISISKKTGLDPRFVELLLRESDELIVAIPIKELVDNRLVDVFSLSSDIDRAHELLNRYSTIFIVYRDKTYWSNAGLDTSNHPLGVYSVPPRNLDRIAKNIRDRIAQLTGKSVAVVICDTEIFFNGSLDLARGSYGIEPIEKGFASLDLYGKPKFGGVDSIVHEVCNAAALVMRQTAQGIPVAIIKGVEYEKCECGLYDRMHREPREYKKIIKKILAHTRKVLGIKHFLKLFIS